MGRIESPSSINMYKQCPRRYYYAYIEKIPGKESIYTIRGQVVHKALESFFQTNIELINDENYEILLKVVIMNLFNSYWRENIGKINLMLSYNPVIAEHYYYESLEMIGRWFEVFIARMKNEMLDKNSQEAFLALKPATEQRFVADNFSVQGFIDAIHENSDGVTLIDYKTSRKNNISEEYRLQLGIYALLYRENKNVLPKSVGIFFLGDGSEKLIDVDSGLIKEAEDECREIQEKTRTNDKKDYEKKPGRLCKYSGGQCDYYDICKPFD